MLIGYARVSTIDQHLDLQLRSLRVAGCSRIFEEKKSGKAGTNRPALAAALDFLRADDVLVVWKLDRLGRSLVEVMRTLDDLQQRKIHFQSMTEHFDSETPHGRFALQIHGAMAEYFLALNRERTREGLKAAIARGRKGGRPPALSADDVAVARALLASRDLTITQIAKRLKVNRATLYNYFPGGRGGLVSPS